MKNARSAQEGIVLSTTDYSKFKPLLEDISKERLDKVAESFKKYGYISCPITINENFEVIDGRARLAACKLFKLPVEYVIIEGAGIEDCYKLNKDKGTWTKEDYKYIRPEIRKSGSSILCKGCKERSQTLALIDRQIEYWIKQKMKFLGELENKTEDEKQDAIKLARREYQRKFYERHPEKRKEYQDRFYKRQSIDIEDPKTNEAPCYPESPDI